MPSVQTESIASKVDEQCLCLFKSREGIMEGNDGMEERVSDRNQ